MRRSARRARTTTCAAALLLVAGCLSTEDLAPPIDGSMAALGSSGGHDSETLERGRRVYLTKCTHCHSPERIADYPAARWPGILDTMAKRARLTVQERADVQAYVLAASRLAFDAG